MPEHTSVGDAVYRRRVEVELSQVDLAILSGLSRGTIRNIEKGAVTPNDSNWRALESVLAWAPGSFEFVRDGNSPIEILPSPVLKPILRELVDIEKSTGFSRGPLGVADFKAITLSADTDGKLPGERRDQLVDLMYEILPTGDAEELLDALDEFFEVGSTISRPLTSVSVGDTVIHRKFGPGKVMAVDEDKGGATIDFGGDLGVKRLILRYAPLTNVTELGKLIPLDKVDVNTMNENESSSLARHLGLSGEAVELLTGGSVIDYEVVKPDDAANIAVVTLIVKKTSAPLSKEDRQYLGKVWDVYSLDGIDEPPF